MRTFEFSIVASGLDPEVDDFTDRFHDAGCDDATISFQKGKIIVDFARKAVSLDAAIFSAALCIRKVGARIEQIYREPLASLESVRL